MDAAAWLHAVLLRYRVRPEAAAEILAHCDVEVHDWSSTRGGGIMYQTGPHRWLIVLYTAQDEAALHEAAHVHYELIQTDDWIARFRGEYFHQADLAHHARFKRVRQACHEGVYGDGKGFAGYRTASVSNPWYTTEMYAGLVSLVMGQVDQMPPPLRAFYDRPGCIYQPREMIYMPMMWG